MSETLSSAPPDAPWTASDTTFGARLALIRQRMGWNAKEAALACGIPPQSWRTWEAGGMPRGSSYFELCAQIASTTGCDYGWLVDRRPSKSTLPKPGSKPRDALSLVKGHGRGSGPHQPGLLASLPTQAVAPRNRFFTTG